VKRIQPEFERAILSIRRRLRARGAPAACSRLTEAMPMRAELKALSVRPLVFGRTIERVR
jgi:hypothetical protein